MHLDKSQIKGLLQSLVDNIPHCMASPSSSNFTISKALCPSSSYSYGKTAALAALATVPLAILVSELRHPTGVVIPSELRELMFCLLKMFSTCVRKPIMLYKRLLYFSAPTRVSNPYRTYASETEEDAYWSQAESDYRMLASSSVFSVAHKPGQGWNASARNERPITYYAPKLLPAYRERRVKDPNASEFALSPKAFVKWHWLVFPERTHPTLSQAPRLMKHLSSRDLRQIRRISQSVKSAKLEHELASEFDRTNGDRKHRNKRKWAWAEWLEHKGPDIVICFEDGA